jgi:hypothetical protein
MDARDIITTVSNMSIGLDQPSDSDIPIFLRFLNQAYFELLRVTALTNPLLPKIRETLDCTDGVVDNPSQKIFSIRSVYVPSVKVQLKRANIDALMKLNPELSDKASTYPDCWYYDSAKLNVYPLYTGQIGVFYVPNPQRMTIDTTEDGIYIPDLYQSLLIDGTSYYLFQSETGFKDSLKMADAKSRFEKGGTELASYMRALSGQTFYSSYSAV